MSIFSIIKALWLTIRSNPVFVSVEGAVIGALLNAIDDELVAGHLDLSRAGINKLISVALIAAITALRLLYRPAPGTNPNR